MPMCLSFSINVENVIYMATKSCQDVDFVIANFYHKCLSKSSVIINQLFASFNAVVVIYDKLFLGNNFVKRLNSDFKNIFYTR